MESINFQVKTKRLILKDHSLENAVIYNQWWNDQELMDLDGDDPPPEKPETLEESSQFLQKWIKQNSDNNQINYAVHMCGNDELIGYGQISRIDTFNRHCTLGIMIGRKDLWGQGYGYEILEAVINYCFIDLNLNRIATKIFSFNQRSINLFKKLDFTHEGTERKKILKYNQYFDDLDFGLLRSEWAKL